MRIQSIHSNYRKRILLILLFHILPFCAVLQYKQNYHCQKLSAESNQINGHNFPRELMINLYFALPTLCTAIHEIKYVLIVG